MKSTNFNLVGTPINNTNISGTGTKSAFITKLNTTTPSPVLLCGSHSSSFSDPCSGASILEDSNTDPLNVYPNPTNHFVHIKGIQAKSTKIRLTNIHGAVILTEQIHGSNNTIDLTNLPNGIYFLEIMTDQLLSTHRIIKQ